MNIINQIKSKLIDYTTSFLNSTNFFEKIESIIKKMNDIKQLFRSKIINQGYIFVQGKIY